MKTHHSQKIKLKKILKKKKELEMPGKSALLQRKDHNEKAAVYKPRREASGKTSIVNSLILDLRPPEV